RRLGRRAGRVPRLRAAALGRDPGQRRKVLSGRQVPRAGRPDHRPPQRLDRPEDLAQRRAARVLCPGLSAPPATSERPSMQPLAALFLRPPCPPEGLAFETTAELADLDGLFGHERAFEAL